MKKTNLINDVLIPALGCIGCGMLLAVTFQMWEENRHALLSEKVGPTEISCAQLSKPVTATTRCRVNIFRQTVEAYCV